jgi:hypothetical protein
MTTFHRLGEPGGPFDPWAWFNLIGMAGCVCWVVAYLLIIRQCFRDQSYGLPLVAICLNFAWEFLASWVLPNPVPLWHAFDRIWFFVDLVIVYQLLRYGPALQRIPEVRRFFYPLVALTTVAGGIGLYTFHLQYRDILGLVGAFIINLVMSVTFIAFYFARREQGGRGLSVGAAWFKMVGTLGTSIECHYVIGMGEPWLPSLSFLHFLSVSIFAVDALYVFLVTKHAREQARGETGMEAAAVGPALPSAIGTARSGPGVTTSRARSSAT